MRGLECNRETDRTYDYYGNTALCTRVHRAVKKSSFARDVMKDHSLQMLLWMLRIIVDWKRRREKKNQNQAYITYLN